MRVSWRAPFGRRGLGGGMSPVAHGDLPQTEKLPLAEVGRKENMPLYASKKRLK